MFFLVVVSTFQLVTDLVGESRVRLVATALAQERVEQVRNLEFDDVGTQGGIPPGVLEQVEVVSVNGQDFEVSTTVVFIDDPFDGQAPDDPISTDYKRVRVEVDWGGAFAAKTPVVMLTDVVPNGLESIAGGGTLFVNVINASGVPVANAQVSVENGAVDPAIDLETVSDNNGRVALPGAPTCVDCYEISVTKTGFTSDRTYSTTEVANPLKPHATVIEGEVTAITLSIDQAASLQVRTTGPRSANYPAFAGVQFRLTGSKIIGTNTLDEPVVKYDESHSSGPGGLLTISGLEWDTYEVYIPEPSSVDFAGSLPISPFSLLPGANVNLTVVTAPATPNNLLVAVQQISGSPIATASATISRPGFVATGSAGPAGVGDMGQVLFPSLSAGNYSVLVTHPDYQSATAAASVSGDSKQAIIMESN